MVTLGLKANGQIQPTKKKWEEFISSLLTGGSPTEGAIVLLQSSHPLLAGCKTVLKSLFLHMSRWAKLQPQSHRDVFNHFMFKSSAMFV